MRVCVRACACVCLFGVGRLVYFCVVFACFRLFGLSCGLVVCWVMSVFVDLAC